MHHCIDFGFGSWFVPFFMGNLTINLAVTALIVVALWMSFDKAGKPGWAAIVPFYNLAVFFETAGRPWWWLFLMLIPVANIVFYILGCVGFAKAFGRSGGFAVGLIFLPFVFFPIVGFSKEIQYVGTPPQI